MQSDSHRSPMRERQAQWHAAKLRKRYGNGLSYPAIALIMGEYHGIWRSQWYWRDVCRRRGCGPAHNRGYAVRREPVDA
jgi:hypothetical protein